MGIAKLVSISRLIYPIVV